MRFCKNILLYKNSGGCVAQPQSNAMATKQRESSGVKCPAQGQLQCRNKLNEVLLFLFQCPDLFQPFDHKLSLGHFCM